MKTAFLFLAVALISSPHVVVQSQTFSSVAAAANATSTLSTLVLAAQTAGLAANASGPILPGTLSDPDLVATVFAPTNEAFAAYLLANNLTAAQLLAAPSLGDILKFHVVPGVAAQAANLTDGQVVPTLLGPSLTLFLSGGNVTVSGGQNNATVTTADVAAGQSIVHIIDSVLIPPAAAPAPAPTSG